MPDTQTLQQCKKVQQVRCMREPCQAPFQPVLYGIQLDQGGRNPPFTDSFNLSISLQFYNKPALMGLSAFLIVQAPNPFETIAVSFIPNPFLASFPLPGQTGRGICSRGKTATARRTRSRSGPAGKPALLFARLFA
ncbi:hypothetical protein [Paraburkholderia sartisoli]|uniref:hypothetical protein n=1 Tax=Paraburkholderia sartisoli TaxID=83784 RepID=UPI001160ABA4|nr:hypothetical protein [Paraburkholderia sartisoli]